MARFSARHNTTLCQSVSSFHSPVCWSFQRRFVATVKFVTDQINVTRDAKGNVIDGDPEHPLEVIDIWTFARNTRSRNPNWTLIETRVPN